MISPEAAVDLTLFPLLSVRLSLCLSLVVGFFFLAAIWVDLILVSNCGGWFAVEVLLRQWILVAGGCAVDVVAIVDDNGNEIIYYFNV